MAISQHDHAFFVFHIAYFMNDVWIFHASCIRIVSQDDLVKLTGFSTFSLPQISNNWILKAACQTPASKQPGRIRQHPTSMVGSCQWWLAHPGLSRRHGGGKLDVGDDTK